jgi:arylsulfatase A-like enzyme
MKSIDKILLSLILLVGLIVQADDRPNIVLIMGDDIGFADIGCFGSEIDTPNLDKMGYGGMRFTSGYNMAKCNPTRSSMLTGTFWSGKNAQSLGALMGKAGYTTLASGKEHYDAWVPERCKAMNSFQKSFIHYGGAGPFFAEPSIKYHLDRESIAIKDMKLSKPYFKTSAITDYAVNFLEETKNDKKPFFLYVAYEAAHYPIHAQKEDFAKYNDKYLKGWDHFKKERYAKQQKMGLLDEGTVLSPSHGLTDGKGQDYLPWDSVSDDLKNAMTIKWLALRRWCTAWIEISVV